MREIDAWFTILHFSCSTASQAKIFFKVYLTFSCPLLHSSNLSWSALREKETYNKTNHFLIRQSWLFKKTNQKTLPCVELKYVSINLNVLVLCGISLTSFAFGDFLGKNQFPVLQVRYLKIVLVFPLPYPSRYLFSSVYSFFNHSSCPLKSTSENLGMIIRSSYLLLRNSFFEINRDSWVKVRLSGEHRRTAYCVTRAADGKEFRAACSDPDRSYSRLILLPSSVPLLATWKINTQETSLGLKGKFALLRKLAVRVEGGFCVPKSTEDSACPE